MQKKQELKHKTSPPTISIQPCCIDTHLFPYTKTKYYVFQIVIFSLNYGSCREKKSITQITHRKRIFPDTQTFSMLDVWYRLQVPKAAPANPTSCSGGESAPGSRRGHPAALRTRLAKATVLTALERVSGMTQAQPCHPSMPSCREREKNPKHRFKGKKSAQHLKGGSVDSPPHPLCRGVFLTLVVGEQLEEAPSVIRSLPAPLPVIPHL